MKQTGYQHQRGVREDSEESDERESDNSPLRHQWNENGFLQEDRMMMMKRDGHLFINNKEENNISNQRFPLSELQGEFKEIKSISSNSTNNSSWLLDSKNKGNIFSANYEENQSKKIMKLIKTPRDYQQQVFNSLLMNRNSIWFMETGKGKTFIAIMLIKHLLTNQKNSDNHFNLVSRPQSLRKKAIFLVCDSALISQQVSTIEINSGWNVGILQGKKGKKVKNDYTEFRQLFMSKDIFVAIPDVLYKFLSIGFVKFNEIEVLIFDECHHCDSNHSYNLIMNEFYFFYKLKNHTELPRILGLTASPLKTKIVSNIKDTAWKAMTQWCENLDAVVVIDPEMKMEKEWDYFENSKIDYTDYIETLGHLGKKSQFDAIYNYLKNKLFIPLLTICVIGYNSNCNGNTAWSKEFKENYLNYIDEKFNTEDFLGYTTVLNKNKQFTMLGNQSVLFRIFEKIQRHWYMLIDHTNIHSIRKFLQHYNIIYVAKANKNSYDCMTNTYSFDQNYTTLMTEIDELTPNEVKHMCSLFNNINSDQDTWTNISYQSDRLEKLLQKIGVVFFNNPESRIIIFVSNRIVANFWADVINEHFSEFEFVHATSIIGVNKKKSEYGNCFLPSISLNQMNRKINEFNLGKYNILIGTSTVEEGLDIQSCDVVIVYTELNTAKSYIQMKGRARKEKKEFIAFTNNKVNTMQNIQNFIALSHCMSTLFKGNTIFTDFKRPNFMSLKELNYLKDSDLFFYTSKTEAKITIKNVNQIWNEILLQLKKTKIDIIVIKTSQEIKKTSNIKKYSLKLEIKSEGLFSNPKDSMKIYESKEYPDKITAENECWWWFIKKLFKENVIDEHFKVVR